MSIGGKSKRNYNYIQLSTRKTLIKLVYKDGMQIKEAAAMIGINYSTAKHIIKTFKKTGNIETRLMLKNKMSPIDIDLLEQKLREEGEKFPQSLNLNS